jgi:LmbE family N-acetylglucosaminyl deacetylase
MDWKKERDALIAQTFAFVQSVTGRIEETARLEAALAPAPPLGPPPDGRDAPMEAAPLEAMPFEPVPADTAAADPVAQIETPTSAALLPPVVQSDVKDEIQARINSFRAHQDRFNRERAEYFSATLQRLRATIEAPLPRVGQIDQPPEPLS